MTSPTRLQRVRGCLFGSAYGDAMGMPTEFLGYEEILKRFPPDGPRQLPGDDLHYVTDDTQMALAVGEAMLQMQAADDWSPSLAEKTLRETFVEWANSPDNFRAPGKTCMTACWGLEAGKPWVQATIPRSKGCGANMRVTPVALAPLEETLQNGLAQFQAAITHGHPTGLAAADVTCHTIRDLMAGGEPQTLPQRLREYIHSQRTVYHQEWLSDLWKQAPHNAAEDYIRYGWDECLGVLDRLQEALKNPNRQSDPCLATGEGWIAEEAWGTGLLCFLLYPEEPIEVLRRAAATAGDSDSIACLAGAFAGAALGDGAWPTEWSEKIEYRERMERIVQAFA